MDVAVKGMYWLLEESRVSADFKQFILIGGVHIIEGLIGSVLALFIFDSR